MVRYIVLVLMGLCLTVYATYQIVVNYRVCSASQSPNPSDPLSAYFNEQSLAVDWKFRSSVLDIVRPIEGKKPIVIIDYEANEVFWNGWLLFGKLKDGDERISTEEFTKRMEAKFGHVVCIRQRK